MESFSLVRFPLDAIRIRICISDVAIALESWGHVHRETCSVFRLAAEFQLKLRLFGSFEVMCTENNSIWLSVHWTLDRLQCVFIMFRLETVGPCSQVITIVYYSSTDCRPSKNYDFFFLSFFFQSELWNYVYRDLFSLIQCLRDASWVIMCVSDISTSNPEVMFLENRSILTVIHSTLAGIELELWFLLIRTRTLKSSPYK